MDRKELATLMHQKYGEFAYFNTFSDPQNVMFQLIKMLEIKGIITFNEEDQIDTFSNYYNELRKLKND